MFSVIFICDNKYWVIDDKSLKVHSLSKESLDAMVASAKEENIRINGVDFLSGDVYNVVPVALEGVPNIYNALPYVQNVTVSGIDSDSVGYQNCFYTLVSIGSNYVDKFEDDEILSKIGLFAWYSLRVTPECRISQTVINKAIDNICCLYPRVYYELRNEPNPRDVLEKFCISPRFTSSKKKLKREV